MTDKRFDELSTEEKVLDIEKYFHGYNKRMRAASAPAWRPAEGETLSGQITQLKMGESRDGYGSYPIVVIEEGRTGNPIAIHAFHTLLRESFRDAKVDVGDMVAVTYLGERITNDSKDKPEKDQTTYYLYYVEKIDLTAEIGKDVEDGFTFDA